MFIYFYSFSLVILGYILIFSLGFSCIILYLASYLVYVIIFLVVSMSLCNRTAQHLVHLGVTIGYKFYNLRILLVSGSISIHF
jgi:hypothetical protein